MKKKLNLGEIKVTSFSTSVDSQEVKGGLRPISSFEGVICQTACGGACPETWVGAYCSTEPQGLCSRIC